MENKELNDSLNEFLGEESLETPVDTNVEEIILTNSEGLLERTEKLKKVFITEDGRRLINE